ncbi:unnamed protein product [Blepharisma stoltei]|uniref:Uncharacterized protein n=1 Tax=Blepharisma stoltei TaxID=1481888 RepID=A0AAU9JPU3_9CILI|nr:unnamed protein product [Blepharisma stoltei]
MDLRPSSENEHFLLSCFGGPYKGALYCLTLKAAVIIIAVIDIVLGALCFLELAFILLKQYYSEVDIVIGLHDLLDIVALFFALKGISGITKVDSLLLHPYSQYKTVELCFLIPLRLVKHIVFCEELGICGWGYFVFGIMIANLVSFFFAKTVWSAYIRLSNNETLMVMHGKEVVEMMQQQPRVLGIQPVYAVPGQTIIQTPVGQAVRPVV